MGWTKNQLIDQAFEEIGLASYVFNIGPEQRQGALRRLDSMMATWNAKGIRLGYALPSSPDASDGTQDSGLPDSANEAVYTNLAVKIAPMVGKQVSQDTRNAASQGFNVLMSRATFPPQQQLPNTLPRGAGNKPWRTANNPFMPTPTDPLMAAEGGDQIEFE
jgi:hypothetical protein